MKRIYSVIGLMLLASALFLAQENVNEEIISIVAEDISAVEENGTVLETLTDKLFELESDPVRINSGSLRETARLFFLSEYQVRALTEYVRTNGRIVSQQEISNIRGFDVATVKMMLPFITFGDKKGDISRRRWLRQTMITNLSLKPGTHDTTTIGSPIKTLTKYRIETGHFIAGFTAEKDEGEKFLSGNPQVPDFLSGYICYTGNGPISKVVAGDFSARFGLGTIINTGFRAGMSLAEPGVISSECVIRPYTSTDENNFFRGAAAVVGGKKTEVTLFASLNKIDATTATDTDSLNIYVKSLYTAGLHNTSGTLLKKDLITELTWGINIMGYFRKITAGLLISGNSFSLPFKSSGSEPGDIFDFSGKRNLLAGFYYSTSIKRFILSGEMSTGPELHPAVIQSLTLVPDDRIALIFVYRYYSPSFHSFHGKGVLSGSNPENEEALTGSVRFEAAKRLFISAGSELKRYMWVKYLTNFPSHAIRNEIRIKYLPERFNVEAVYNYRKSESNLNETTGMPEVKEMKTNSFSLRVKYAATEYFTSVTRVGLKTCSGSETPGMLFSQDAIVSLKSLPLRLWFRHCIFNTGGWDTRIYLYENDLVNSFSVPALSGKGARTYLMAEWNFAGKLRLRLKYGITSKIINPDNEIFTDEIKFQVSIRL